MNTPESDMEQMKFAREWVRAHAAQKMAKYEKKLRRAAKDFFGHPVAIAYLKPGVILEIKDIGEKAKIVPDEGTIHTGALWERMAAPRYNEYKTGENMDGKATR